MTANHEVPEVTIIRWSDTTGRHALLTNPAYVHAECILHDGDRFTFESWTEDEDGDQIEGTVETVTIDRAGAVSMLTAAIQDGAQPLRTSCQVLLFDYEAEQRWWANTALRAA